jgi:hypothetical protein
LLWPATGGFDSRGEPAVALFSQQILVNWNSNRRDMLDPQGTKISVDASVVVDIDVPIGSLFWRGDRDELAEDMGETGTGSDMLPDEGFLRAVAFKENTDFRGSVVRREMGLKRLHDSMQTQST